MRTLSRPMFNMGGPIKQGVMNGIREPKKDGGPLVGSSAYPKTGGREHHFVVTGTIGGIAAANAARIAATRAAMRYGPRAINWAKNIFRGTGAGQVAGGGGLRSASEYARTQMAPLSKLEKMKSWFGTAPAGKYLAGSPEGKFLSGAPGKLGWVGGKIGSTLKGAARSPLTVGAGAYYGVPWGYKKLFGDKKDETGGGFLKSGAAGGASLADLVAAVDTPKKDTGLSDSAKKAFANKQREERVQKYLDMMGYDASKKTAIADALIDASKIVGERGTLDPKNITQELINPIIQATSKRLDKPQQIREAVGLMATKAEIEKDLSKETDALKTRALELQIEGAEKTLAESASFEAGLSKFISDRKGKVDKVTLERISRLLAKEHGEPFKKVTGDEQITVNGIYMKEGNIFRVTEGVSEQLV